MVMQSTRTFNNSVKTVNNKSTVSISSGLQDDQSDYKQMQANQMIKSRNKLNGSSYNKDQVKHLWSFWRLKWTYQMQTQVVHEHSDGWATDVYKYTD